MSNKDINILVLLFLTLTVGCGISPAVQDYSGFPCDHSDPNVDPCLSGFHCDTCTDTCITSNDSCQDIGRMVVCSNDSDHMECGSDDRWSSCRAVSDIDLDCDRTVVVDLCDGVVCDPGEICREIDGECVMDNDVCTPEPCNGNGTCSDVGGSAVCSCINHFELPDCGQCEIGWGGSLCDVCAGGFHLVGTDCVIDENCNGNSCNSHGSCNDSTGVVVCTCTGSYDVSNNCLNCQTGLQDNNNDGNCAATCATSGLNCGSQGSCTDASGTAICECSMGWDGLLCDVCAGGFHLEGSDCVIDENCQVNSCNSHGSCNDSTGVVVCTCTGNYDISNNCLNCQTGLQDFDNDGNCTATCATSGLNCGSFGACQDTSGTAACVCTGGYDPATDCASCLNGTQDNDTNGVCSPTCTTSGLNCGSFGSCDDTSGTAACICTGGYDPATDCASCFTGTQDNDTNGVCAVDCANSGLVCNASGHGSCDDNSGTAACVCTDFWSGAACTVDALDCRPSFSLNGGQADTINNGSNHFLLNLAVNSAPVDCGLKSLSFWLTYPGTATASNVRLTTASDLPFPNSASSYNSATGLHKTGFGDNVSNGDLNISASGTLVMLLQATLSSFSSGESLTVCVAQDTTNPALGSARGTVSDLVSSPGCLCDATCTETLLVFTDYSDGGHTPPAYSAGCTLNLGSPSTPDYSTSFFLDAADVGAVCSTLTLP